MGKNLKVKVCGDWACFSRPEMKVERVSYEVMTPSAARGVLEAIFWKPAFQWHIRKIHVLKPIRRLSLRRTEVKEKPSLGGSIETPATLNRTRRNTLALRKVAYVIEANVHLVGYGVKENNRAKYREQFRRRVNSGACFRRPYLGCREFAAHFAPWTSDEAPPTIDRSDDLGRMFFGWRYDENYASTGAHPDDDYDFSDAAEPVFFDASLENGTLVVPDKYDQLKPR
jgi:CRISPR-associated protein Cas5d